MPPIPKVSTSTFATFGERNAGSVCAQMNVLHAQTQQGKQYNHRLLFVPRDIIGNRQFVDIVQLEDFFQLQGDNGKRITVVALAGIEHTRIPFISPKGNLLYLYFAHPAVRITVSCGNALAKSV